MGLSHTTPGLSNTPESEGEHNMTALLGMLRRLTDDICRDRNRALHYLAT